MQEDAPLNAEIDFPSLVRRIRTLRDMTQEQLAHELGVTFSTVNGWENRKHRPSPLAVKQLVRLAGELGLNLETPGGTPGASDSSRRERLETARSSQQKTAQAGRKTR